MQFVLSIREGCGLTYTTSQLVCCVSGLCKDEMTTYCLPDDTVILIVNRQHVSRDSPPLPRACPSTIFTSIYSFYHTPTKMRQITHSYCADPSSD
ncbi:hypothetical protein NPIL_696391 [Nephila pilipes]|uniref:Uncharacterized protein n=1 Tax=Nephila pilipes TaxID=299642 RepID=A0A8X6T307_NEPPI|nr:hypothetical protein NPIL_696391 [Nephila pilipes]